ncbi:protein NTM1-like 9 isoform X2 [Alnus glutinosa]|uniref:protein NTM1-like 9 isoform X2 n=1 Tax=Alnus glutinosa TaxID=3517 RepID=UPI002D7912F8|nr:protein NTM1-like 9 isoform X2 [Alnus glutinosa]
MAMLSLTNQPCGVRFSPTDEELIQRYLRPKISGNDEEVGFIREVNFFKREPRELPDFSGIETITKDQEWFFFSQHDLKHRNGNRLNRKTDAGYWKVTGTDLEIWSVGGESLIGKKKIPVFYEGLSPNSKITDWVLHEYHATPTELQGTNPAQVDLQLEEALNMFYDLPMESPDGKIFSPLHSQMQSELGSSGGYFTMPNDLNNGHIGVQLQYGLNEPDASISEFLDSIFCNPDETLRNLGSVKDSGSDAEGVNALSELQGPLRSEEVALQSKSDKPEDFASDGAAEQTYNSSLYNSSLKESSDHLTTVSSGEGSRTGIRIRTRQSQNEPLMEGVSKGSVAQGIAPRRLRLQCKLQVLPVQCSPMSADWSGGAGGHESKPIATEEGGASGKHVRAGSPRAAAANSAYSEPRSIISDSDENSEISQDPSTGMRPSSMSKGDILTGINGLSVFSKAAPLRRKIGSFRVVVVVVVVIIIFAGVWRSSLKF